MTGHMLLILALRSSRTEKNITRLTMCNNTTTPYGAKTNYLLVYTHKVLSFTVIMTTFTIANARKMK